MNTTEQTATHETSVVHLDGRLDFLSSSALRDELAEQVATGRRWFVVDLGDVTYVDSSGLGALISGLKMARQSGGDLRIARPGDQLRTVLSLTSLDSVFTTYATVEEALADH